MINTDYISLIRKFNSLRKLNGSKSISQNIEYLTVDTLIRTFEKAMPVQDIFDSVGAVWGKTK